MHIEEMPSAHPAVRGARDAALIGCIKAFLECAAVCTSCADACRRCEDACRKAGARLD